MYIDFEYIIIIRFFFFLHNYRKNKTNDNNNNNNVAEWRHTHTQVFLINKYVFNGVVMKRGAREYFHNIILSRHVRNASTTHQSKFRFVI